MESYPKKASLQILGFNPINMNIPQEIGNKSPPPRIKKPSPFVLGVDKNQPNFSNHEFIENQLAQHSPILCRRQSPIMKGPMKIKNKNLYGVYRPYFKNNGIDDGSYDLHKANWDVSKENKPTAKLRSIKLGNPFKVGSKHKTNFGCVYSAGGIPCRIEHGGVGMKLVWSIPPEALDYDPILITCFEGLLETVYPYSFVGKECIRELLSAKGASEKVVPILSKLIIPLKEALRCDDPEVYCEAMNVLEMLSNLVGENLDKYLHFFLQNINKRSFNLQFKERVFDLLRVLEQNGGPNVAKEIKKKIPTYTSLI